MYKKIFLFLVSVSLVQYCIGFEPNTFIATIPGFNNSVAIAITPNNFFAYVSEQGSNNVVVIDTNPLSPTFNTIIVSLASTFNDPQGLAITPNGEYVYVCDGGSNSVIVIQTSDNTIVSTPTLASTFNGPYCIAITPDGSRAYVCNQGNNTVNVIQINNNNTILNTPDLNGILSSPYAIAITSDGNYAYITNSSGSVTVIDTNPSSPTYNQPLTTPGLGSVNNQPEGLAITPNGQLVYVGDGKGTIVNVIDSNPLNPTFNTVLNEPNLTSAFNGSAAVAITANGNYAYVVNSDGAQPGINSAVSVIDTNPLSPTFNSTLNTPGLTLSNVMTSFQYLAITPNDRFVYVIDNNNNTVDVIYTGILDAPQNFSGCKTRNRFLLQIDNINHLTWSAPSGNIPASYAIYRDAALTQLVAMVPATGALQYDDHNRNPNVTYTYYIVSADAYGTISAAAVTTVTQNC